MKSSNLTYIYAAFLWASFLLMGQSAIYAQPDETNNNESTGSAYDTIVNGKLTGSPVIEYTPVARLEYPSSSIDTRELDAGVIDSIKKETAFWYADYSSQAAEKKQAQQKKGRKSFLTSGTFNVLVWVLMLIGFTMLLIWYLADSSIHIFKRREKVFDDADSGDGQIMDSNDLSQQLQQAITQQDFRLATRLMFLQLLKKMHDGDIIEYHHDFTNNDYRRHLQGTRYATSFDVVARQYEYIWYGKRQPGAGHFEVIRNDFVQIENQLATA